MSEDVYPLDDAALEMLAGIERQRMACGVAEQTVLNYFALQQKLGAGWALSPNRRELVRQNEQAEVKD